MFEIQMRLKSDMSRDWDTPVSWETLAAYALYTEADEKLAELASHLETSKYHHFRIITVVKQTVG